MKRLPESVLALLETLPDATAKIVLNTDRRGHWEIEAFARYTLDVPPAELGLVPLRRQAPGRKGSRSSY